MAVRGAPLIGATAAYGLALAARSDPSDASLDEAERLLEATRPTAHNLVWALRTRCAARWRMCPAGALRGGFREAARICEEDVEQCRRIGVARSRHHSAARRPR